MSTAPIQNTSSQIGGTPAAASSPSPGGALGETQFLKLLMTQMKDQDPLNPGDPTQYMAELAQFTSVEQQTNVATSTAALAQEQNAATAIALIGHSVTYLDAKSGQPVTGTVQSAQVAGGNPTLTINGIGGIGLSRISEVA
jgi:flagellar basal-body rod modification protein FlgD